MKTKLSCCLVAFFILSLPGFGQNKETRNVETFTKIAFRTAGKLYLRQGSPQKVELEGSKDLLEKIETNVSGGKLVIESARKWSDWNWRGSDLKVYVTVKDIEAVGVSGSGDLSAETKLTGTNFDLSVSGSGSFSAEIEASGDISANVSGSGNMELSGKCKNFESDISGSGDISLSATIADKANFELTGSGKVKATGSAQSVKAVLTGSGQVRAANFEADKCDVHISGSGDVEINVKSELDANISGSGSVTYKGNPSHVNSHSSGSGHVHKM